MRSLPVPLHSFRQLVSKIVDVNFPGSGMIDDTDENIMKVINLLLSTIESLQIFTQAALGELQLVVLVSDFSHCFFKLLDLSLGKIKFFFSFFNIGNHVRIRLINLV